MFCWLACWRCICLFAKPLPEFPQHKAADRLREALPRFALSEQSRRRTAKTRSPSYCFPLVFLRTTIFIRLTFTTFRFTRGFLILLVVA